MIMVSPEESVKSQHSYRMMMKLSVSTTKIKYSTQIYMIDQNVYDLFFVASLMKFYTTVITRSLKCMPMWAHSKSE